MTEEILERLQTLSKSRANQFDLGLRQKLFFEELQCMQAIEASNQAVICRRFGCGRELNIQEQLFGHHCVDHLPIVPVCWDGQLPE